MAGDGLHEPRAEERNHGQGDGIGCEEGENDGQRQRGEEIFADAVEQRHGEEDDDGGQGGGEHRQRDFPSALFGRDGGRLTHFEVAVDIFQHDDGVVDQAGEGERKAAQHHRIDRTSAELQRDEGGERRKRNGEEYGDGGAHASEKDENHERGEQQSERAFVQERLDRVLDELRLIEHDRGAQRIRGCRRAC